jgi:hypothetical protein
MQPVVVVGVRGCDIRPSGTGLEFQLQLWGFTANRGNYYFFTPKSFVKNFAKFFVVFLLT